MLEYAYNGVMLAYIARRFRHWLTPHQTNNFRARLLHNTGYLALLGVFFAVNLFVRLLDSSPLHILGFTSSITIEEVVRLTNEQRLAQGLPPLAYNETLSDAARRKAANMFEENYWSHNSPTGKSPWVWFSAAGYRYTHAGENLAKDFGSSDRMMEAWMNSATHKANIVSDKFHDIGIAVVPGSLQGHDTVLVVQLFGSTAAGSVPSDTPQVAEIQGTSVKSAKTVQTAPTPAPRGEDKQPAVETKTEQPQEPQVLELKELATPVPTPLPTLAAGVFQNSAWVNTFNLKKAASLMTTGLLILVLLADVLIAESRKLSRRVGKNWAHILYINVILILVTVVNAGSIL